MTEDFLGRFLVNASIEIMVDCINDKSLRRTIGSIRVGLHFSSFQVLSFAQDGDPIIYSEFTTEDGGFGEVGIVKIDFTTAFDGVSELEAEECAGEVEELINELVWNNDSLVGLWHGGTYEVTVEPDKKTKMLLKNDGGGFVH